MLHNPIYAGAYVYGRRPTDNKRKKPGRPSTARTTAPIGEWEVCIKNTNKVMGFAKGGSALLSELLICGHCGLRMSPSYNSISKTRDRNKKSAKKFFKRALGNLHVKDLRVINIDKSPTFPSAIEEFQKSKEFPEKTKLRRVKYLNNSMGNDHKFIKSKFRYWNVESVHRVQKEQLRNASKGNICAQNSLILN